MQPIQHWQPNKNRLSGISNKLVQGNGRYVKLVTRIIIKFDAIIVLWR